MQGMHIKKPVFFTPEIHLQTVGSGAMHAACRDIKIINFAAIDALYQSSGACQDNIKTGKCGNIAWVFQTSIYTPGLVRMDNESANKSYI